MTNSNHPIVTFKRSSRYDYSLQLIENVKNPHVQMICEYYTMSILIFFNEKGKVKAIQSTFKAPENIVSFLENHGYEMAKEVKFLNAEK